MYSGTFSRFLKCFNYILTLLLGGCDAGVGLGVLGFAVVGGALLTRRWRRR